MSSAIILHGTCEEAEYRSSQYPSLSNSHWIPWLQKQLIIKGIPTVTPEIPNAFMPNYTVWAREFERFDITPETILVGHSCGGGFLVRWLSQHPDVCVGSVVLVAPWLDPEKEKGQDNDFFDFDMDPELVKRTGGVTIFNSDDDDATIQASVKRIMESIPAIKLTEFHAKGHFCFEDLGTDAFPELLDELLKK